MTPKKSNTLQPKSFLIFVIVSLFFWFLTKLSKEYQSSIAVKVNYIQIPDDQMLRNNMSDKININVTASGFKLLYAEMITPKIDIECSNLNEIEEGKFLLDFKFQKAKIQAQLSKGISINYFEPSSIQIQLDKLENKKVRIVPDVTIQFKKSFDRYGNELILPDSILLTGPKSILDTMNFIKTEALELFGVESDVKKKLQINPIYKNRSIAFQNVEIEYQVKVDKFTEGSIEVPFVIVNEPNHSITTFPNTITLKYKVGLNDYDKVNKSLFTIECDYQQSIDNNLNFLIPKIVKSPNFIKDLHLDTKKIEFFLKK